ncbi:MAG: hypothetical protein OXC40_03135 [Proteobacteria bacterium]|nr:hypothetical protein [Pseudomonadota bacterium]
MKRNTNVAGLSIATLLIFFSVIAGCRGDEPLSSNIHGLYNNKHLLKLSEFDDEPNLYQFEVCLKTQNQNQETVAQENSCVAAFTDQDNRPVTLTLEPAPRSSNVTVNNLWQNYRNNLRPVHGAIDAVATLGGGGAVVYSLLAQKRALSTLDSGFSLSELEKMAKSSHVQGFAGNQDELIKNFDSPLLDTVTRSHVNQALTETFNTSEFRQIKTLLSESHSASQAAEESLKLGYDYVVEWAKAMKMNQLEPEILTQFVDTFNAEFKNNPTALKTSQFRLKKFAPNNHVFSDDFVKFFEMTSKAQLTALEVSAHDFFKSGKFHSDVVSDAHMENTIRLFQARGNKFIDIIDYRYLNKFKAFTKVEIFLMSGGGINQFIDFNSSLSQSPKKLLALMTKFANHRGVPPSLMENVKAMRRWLILEGTFQRTLSALNTSSTKLKAQAGKKLLSSRITMAVGLALLAGVTTRQVMLALNHQPQESSLHLGAGEVLESLIIDADYDFSDQLLSVANTQAEESIISILRKLASALNTHSQSSNSDLQITRYCKPFAALSDPQNIKITCYDLLNK